VRPALELASRGQPGAASLAVAGFAELFSGGVSGGAATPDRWGRAGNELVVVDSGAAAPGSRPASAPWLDAMRAGSAWSRQVRPDLPDDGPWAFAGGSDGGAGAGAGGPMAYVAIEVPEARGVDPMDRLGRPVGEGGEGAPTAVEGGGTADPLDNAPQAGAPGCIVVRFPGHYRAPLERPARARAAAPDDGYGEADQGLSRTWRGAEAMEVPFPGVAPRSQRLRRLAEREDVVRMGTGASLRGGGSAVAGGLPPPTPSLVPVDRSRAGSSRPGSRAAGDALLAEPGSSALPAADDHTPRAGPPAVTGGMGQAMDSAVRRFVGEGGSVAAWRSALSRGRPRAEDRAASHPDSAPHARFRVTPSSGTRPAATPNGGADRPGPRFRPTSAARARLAAALEASADTGAVGTATAAGRVMRGRPGDRGNARPDRGPVVINGYNNATAEAVAAAGRALGRVPDWDTERRAGVAVEASGVPASMLARAAAAANPSPPGQGSSVMSMPALGEASTWSSTGHGAPGASGAWGPEASVPSTTIPTPADAQARMRAARMARAPVRRKRGELEAFYGQDGVSRAAEWRPPDPALPAESLRGLALEADEAAAAMDERWEQAARAPGRR